MIAKKKMSATDITQVLLNENDSLYEAYIYTPTDKQEGSVSISLVRGYKDMFPSLVYRDLTESDSELLNCFGDGCSTYYGITKSNEENIEAVRRILKNPQAYSV